MSLWHSDVLVEVSLLPSEEKGWPPAAWFGCSMEVDGRYFDARLDLTDAGKHPPGHRFQAPLKFLTPDGALPHMEIGKTFALWEEHAIGSAKIVALRVTGRTGGQ